ncbi:hypothetical protein P3F56_02340 [cyanobacterium endosymbiont of Epithemia clementina EcSB]|nr:hypothetical protein [cyanobacterium endosymbiont of Epithemia clementina EcSB]WGT68427.1 hypothetical protein P3F56_02340 [cyanobacterium endosymbiont of Epithemia clementina EcSB]
MWTVAHTLVEKTAEILIERMCF